jgi:uncharacterized membrane protein
MSISRLRKKGKINTEAKKGIIVLVIATVSIIIGFILYPFLLNEYGKEWAQFGLISTLLLIGVYGVYLILNID